MKIENLQEIIMWRAILGSVAVVLGLTVLRKYLQKRKRDAYSARISKCTKKGVVYLHQFPRYVAKQVPNLSPFAMKIEMWLRIKNIPYEVVESLEWSQKQQSPFVILNGEEIADSNFIINRLTTDFNLDPTEGLDPPTLGASRAFLHLMEGSLVWTYFLWRYSENADLFAKVFNIGLWSPLAKLVRSRMKKGMRNRCYHIGIARHKPSEIFQIAQDDLLAIERFLGTKQYLCGDKPTAIDCSLFGHLSQIVYVKSMPYPHRTFMEENCPNTLKYVERIRENYWQDWEQITNLGEFET